MVFILVGESRDATHWRIILILVQFLLQDSNKLQQISTTFNKARSIKIQNLRSYTLFTPCLDTQVWVKHSLKKRTLTEQTPSSSSMFSDSSPFYWLKCQPWCNCQQFVPSPPGISAKRQGQGRESMNPMIINSSSQLVRIWCSRLSRLNCPNVPSTETFRNQINQALTKSCQIWASRHRRMRKWFGSWSQRCSHPDRNFRKFLIPIFSLPTIGKHTSFVQSCYAVSEATGTSGNWNVHHLNSLLWCCSKDVDEPWVTIREAFKSKKQWLGAKMHNVDNYTLDKKNLNK